VEEVQDVTRNMGRFGIGIKAEVEAWKREDSEISTEVEPLVDGKPGKRKERCGYLNDCQDAGRLLGCGMQA
jgi:hypothetical protein